MSLRIAREKYYLLLLVSIDQALSMKGQKNYLVPVKDIYTPDWVLNVLKRIGSRGSENGMVLIDYEFGKSFAPEVEGSVGIAYSALFGLCMQHGIPHIRLNHITPVDFNLYWKDGRFYQQAISQGKGVASPTNVQMLFLNKVSMDLLSRYAITNAELSCVNPFLQAFIIPMSSGASKVKAFANDLFHALNILPIDDTMDIKESNHYCALDVDEGKGVYLVIFNHPAIFDYPEDSPEGRCAYGEWKP